ncbi:MAG: GldG family protein [Polyangia bacterium]
MATQINKTKTAANAITFVVMVLLALVAVNIIGSRIARRVDFTQDGLYSLSQASKDLVKNLPDRMTVKAFISQKTLEPKDAQVAQYVRDLLEEYARASNGKFVWEAIDPSGDKALEDEAEKLKVPKLTRTGASQDKLTLASSYLGIALQYQGNVESVPDIKGAEGLEFQITSLIKMLSVKKKKIAFAQSEGELPLQQAQGGHGASMSIVGQFFADYQVTPIGLDKPVADDVDALVIAGPRTAMSERGKWVVDQFLMKGKSVAFLVDGMIVEAANGMQMQMPGSNPPQLGRKNDHGMDDLLEHYGYKIHDDIVMEPQLNAPGPLLVRGKLVAANYPTFVVSTNIDATHPITDRIKGIIFPFTSSSEQVAGKQPGMKVTTLARSSSDAWRQAGLFVLDPEAPIKPTPDRGPFNYAFAAEGKLTSFFAGRPHPGEKGEVIAPPAANVSAPTGPETPIDATQGTSRIVVVSSSGFISDQYLQMINYAPSYRVDVAFALGILDWLVQDDTIAQLRHKVIQSRPINVESALTPLIVKYGNVIGVPLLFILFGIARWRLRTSRRRSAKV